MTQSGNTETERTIINGAEDTRKEGLPMNNGTLDNDSFG